MGRAPFLIVPTGGTPPAPDLPVKTGLQLWLDVLQLDLAHGDAVPEWPDVSGNGRHAAQATSASQPTFRKSRTGTFVEFDGVDDRLTTPTWTALSQPNDVFMVAKARTLPTFGAFWSGMSNSNNHRIATLSGAWNLAAGSQVSGGTADTSVHVFAARFNGASSSLAVDGVTVLSGNPGSQSLTGVHLGTDYGTSFLPCGIAEFLLYDSALSAGDHDAVEDYLIAKWMGAV